MSNVAPELPLSCPECGGPLTAVRKVKIETVRSEGNRDLPIGDRTDIVKMRCPEHGEIGRFEHVTPAGHPMDSIVDDMLAPLREALAPEPRWHEIATEGLPPEGDDVLVCSMVNPADVTIARIGEGGEWWPQDGERWPIYPSHWHPLPKAPG